MDIKIQIGSICNLKCTSFNIIPRNHLFVMDRNRKEICHNFLYKRKFYVTMGKYIKFENSSVTNCFELETLKNKANLNWTRRKERRCDLFYLALIYSSFELWSTNAFWCYSCSLQWEMQIFRHFTNWNTNCSSSSVIIHDLSQHLRSVLPTMKS